MAGASDTLQSKANVQGNGARGIMKAAARESTGKDSGLFRRSSSIEQFLGQRVRDLVHRLLVLFTVVNIYLNTAPSTSSSSSSGKRT